MSLFGLSPLFLSLLATSFFQNGEELDVTGFVAFMAVLGGVVHLIGAFTLRTPDIRTANSSDDESNSSEADVEYVASGSANERTPLLRGKTQPDTKVTIVPVDQDQTAGELIRDPAFWLLAVSTLICLGSVRALYSMLTDHL